MLGRPPAQAVTYRSQKNLCLLSVWLQGWEVGGKWRLCPPTQQAHLGRAVQWGLPPFLTAWPVWPAQHLSSALPLLAVGGKGGGGRSGGHPPGGHPRCFGLVWRGQAHMAGPSAPPQQLPSAGDKFLLHLSSVGLGSSALLHQCWFVGGWGGGRTSPVLARPRTHTPQLRGC